MANIYVKSIGGLDANDGSSWLMAKATAAGATAIDVAGDRVFTNGTHSESNAAATTLNFAGTNASPSWLIAASDAAEPPTATATSIIATTGAGNITINGTVNVFGQTFNLGSGSSTAILTMSGAFADERQWYDSCNFNIVTTSAGALISIGTNVAIYEPKIFWRNCTVKFANASQCIDVKLGGLQWDGGSIGSGSTALTTSLLKFTSAGRSAKAVVRGVDLSNMGAACNLVQAGGGNTINAKFIRCKLPASWTGLPVTGTLRIGDRVEMWDSDNADTSGRLWIKAYEGEVSNENTIINSASNSLKMVAAANAEYPGHFLESCEIFKRNTVIGTAITVTVECVTDGITLTNDEFWAKIEYLGTNGFPLALFATNEKTNILGSATALTTSTAAWTTTGLGAPTKQKISITFTAQEVGTFSAKLYLAKASTTVYFDRGLVVT